MNTPMDRAEQASAVSLDFLIPGPLGPLEARLSLQSMNAPLGIICHPHPQKGGNMDHKVIFMVHKAMSALGMATLRFNYRGVGLSTGSFGEGLGELDDLKAVLAWAQANHPSKPIHLAGFSFGAELALRLTAEQAQQSLVTIAPPVHYPTLKDWPATVPGLIIQGREDLIVDCNQVRAWHAGLSAQVELIEMASGHFFHGQLVALKAHLVEFYRRVTL